MKNVSVPRCIEDCTFPIRNKTIHSDYDACWFGSVLNADSAKCGRSFHGVFSTDSISTFGQKNDNLVVASGIGEKDSAVSVAKNLLLLVLVLR